jgi:hypothetical protein
MNVQPHSQMDNATFLEWVQGREERYELAGGRVVMMTGATMRHGLIVGNLFELLRTSSLPRMRSRPGLTTATVSNLDHRCLPAPMPRSAFRR